MTRRAYRDKHDNPRFEYHKVCPSCGDRKWVKYKFREGSRCIACSASELARKLSEGKHVPDELKAKYYYFCAECESVRKTVNKRKSNYCHKCNRTHNLRKLKDEIYFDLLTMKYVVLAVKPKPVVKVAKKPKKAKLKHTVRKIPTEAIERQRRLNQEHRELQAKYVPIPEPKLSDDDMVALWKKTNEIKLVGEGFYDDYSLGVMFTKSSTGGAFI